MVHEGVKSKICNYCGMKFSQKGSLDSHTKNVHLKIKDFKCELCDYASGIKDSVDKHVSLVHEKRRDFKCESCDKRYGTKNQAQIHFKTVHEGVKAFECERCGKTFPYPHGLKRHIKEVLYETKQKVLTLSDTPCPIVLSNTLMYYKIFPNLVQSGIGGNQSLENWKRSCNIVDIKIGALMHDYSSIIFLHDMYYKMDISTLNIFCYLSTISYILSGS